MATSSTDVEMQAIDLRVTKFKLDKVRYPGIRHWQLLLCLSIWAAIVTGIISFGIGFQLAQRSPPVVAKPKNIIFMVSDGFGLSSFTLARMYQNQLVSSSVSKKAPDQMSPLHLDRFVRGTSHTYSFDSLITDSAAGASAFSCGMKTSNLRVAVDPIREVRVRERRRMTCPVSSD